jgi:6,7-dimethyl-8-ribityllumazine synthase
MGEYSADDAGLDARGMRFGIVASRYNRDLSQQLLDGVCARLRGHGADPEALTVAWVPGAFEIPLAAQRLASSGTVDAVICVGAVVRGDTPHFEYVAGACADGVARVALDTGVPTVFGVLTTDDRAQALARVGGAEGHKGEEAASTAVEMVRLLRRLPGAPSVAG